MYFNNKLWGFLAITVSSMIFSLVFSTILSAEPVNSQSVSMPEMSRITASNMEAPPDWAVMERHLIKTMEETAQIYLDHFARPDGTIYGGSSNDVPGAPNYDDLYEMFYNWPLFYAIGADEKILSDAIKEYNAITRMCTTYPHYNRQQLYDEFPVNTDWFHISESVTFFYNLALGDPTILQNIERAKRFAGLYMNEDPQPQNYDPKYKIIRGTATGRHGPAKEHYDAGYNLEYGHASLYPIVKDQYAELKISSKRREELRNLYNKIVTPCDVPMNLAVTGLVTNSYLYTGEEKYKKWVLEYVDAWMDRIKENNGVLPDNIGRTGKIGEYRNGQWWGGMYGWTGTYSIHMVFGALTVASECAYLLSGDPRYLDMLRSQIDVLLGQSKISPEGQLLVPFKYSPEGWTDYRPMMVRDLSHLWQASMNPEDWARIERVKNGSKYDWNVTPSLGNRTDGGTEAARLMYYTGKNPDWPLHILQADYNYALKMLEIVQAYSIPPKNITQQDWLYHKSPVLTKGLQQVTMGVPQTIYNGGLLRARVRYFDIDRERPGLPEDVAALVETLEADKTVVTFVNLSVSDTHRLIVQAGAFGEHTFSSVTYHEQAKDSSGNVTVSEKNSEVNNKYFEVDLPPGRSITLNIGTHCFVNKPTYAFPWHGEKVPLR